MAYTPRTWQTGDLITAAGLNAIEQGLSNAAGVGVSDSAVAAQVTSGSQTQAALKAAFDHPRAPSIVLVGDSITAYNGGPGYGIWDSKGFFVWANSLLGGRFRVLKNAGVGGDTTTQILARLQADVLAYAPDWVTVLAGTNDVGNSTPVATITANLQSIYNQCRAIGARIVAITLLPRNDLSAANMSNLIAVNQWIRNYCRATPGMVLADMGAAVVDPATTGNVNMAYSVDGIHPNPAGAARMGRVLADALAPLVPASSPLPNIPGESLLTGAFFAGSGTTIANGWALQGGTGATFDYAARTDGVAGSWMRATVANGSAATLLQNVSLGPTIAVGDTLYLAMEVQATNLDPAPAANSQAFYIALGSYDGSSFNVRGFANYWDAGYANFPFPAGRNVLVTSPIVVPAGAQLVQAQVYLQGGGVYQLGRAMLGKGTP